MFNQYIKYIKDNPKGYWFRAKWYGWGWVPATWQGWSVIGIYALLFIVIFNNVDKYSHSTSDTLIGIIFPTLLLIILLLLICLWKGEKPHWSWGKPKK